MFNKIKRFVEIGRIKREMKSGGNILLFELYLSKIFNRYGQVDSILLGKLHDGKCNYQSSFSNNECKIPEKKLLNKEKSDEKIHSDIEQLIRHHIIEPVYSGQYNNYKISEKTLSELLKEAETERSSSTHNISQELINSLHDATSIDEFNSLFPTEYFKYIRQWGRQYDAWKEMEPTETLTLSLS